MEGEGRGEEGWSGVGGEQRVGGIYTHVRLIYSPACTSRGPPGQVERV